MIMTVRVLASESMGVRSYCTFFENNDISLIIDPGCALGPDRFKLPPHKMEIEALWKSWDVINEHLKKSRIVVITHYHYDHHHYRNFALFRSKIVLLKDYTAVNPRQKRRAELFVDLIKGFCEIIPADGKCLNFGDTKIEVTLPLSHGYENEEVKIVGVYIRDKNTSLFYSSDISGLIEDYLMDFLSGKLVKTLIFDGFPTYLIDSKLRREFLEESKIRLNALIDRCGVETLIIDHHSARDLNWEFHYKEILNRRDLRFCGNAAAYNGSEPLYLEARRRLIFGKE